MQASPVEADERSQLPHAAPLARRMHELRPRLRPRVLRRLVFRVFPVSMAELIGDRLLVDPLGDFLVSGLFDHHRKPRLELLQSPADGVFYAFVFHLVSRAFAAGGADVIMRVFVEAIEA